MTECFELEREFEGGVGLALALLKVLRGIELSPDFSLSATTRGDNSVYR